jgi:arylsulfatase A
VVHSGMKRSALLNCFLNGLLLLAMSIIGWMAVDAAQSPSKDSETQPNIILIMAGDIGYECYGAYRGTSYKTPRIDQMATKGIRFIHCYSQPICTPSLVRNYGWSQQRAELCRPC